MPDVSLAPPRIAFRNDVPCDFQRTLHRRVAAHLAVAGATRYANSWLWTKAAVPAAVASGAYAALLWGGFPGGAMLALAVLAAVAALLLGINWPRPGARSADVQPRG